MKPLFVILALGSLLLCACSTSDVVMSPAKIGRPPVDSLSESVADEILDGCILYEANVARWPASVAEIEAGLQLQRPSKFLAKAYITLKEEGGRLTVRYMVPSGAVWDLTFRATKKPAKVVVMAH
jgi:hypothetical protein